MRGVGGWKNGSTRAWRRLRAQVLAENVRTNKGMCTLGIAGVCTGKASHVHHTLGKSVTGDDPRFLAATCPACNQHVGDPSKRVVHHEHRRVSKW